MDLDRIRLLVAAVALPALARAGVVVVDPAGGPGGALLQSAVNAAQDGDILLLRAGDYTDAEITVSNKVLSLVADSGGLPVTLSRLNVILPPGSGGTWLVRGLTITPAPLTTASPASGLTMQGSFAVSTAVWIEDCTVGASQLDWPGFFPVSQAGSAIMVLGAPGSVVRCVGTGAHGFDQASGVVATAGGPGLETFLDGVSVSECTLTGGAGGNGFGDGLFVSDGGPGIAATSTISVMGCALQGGDEGASNGTSVKPGAGLRLDSGLGTVRDSLLLAGNIVGDGTPTAPEVVALGSTVLSFAAPSRTLAADSPVREGQLVKLGFGGVTGDGVWLYVAQDAGFNLVPSRQGAFMLATPLTSPLFLGTITDPSGQLDLQFHMPSLPPGMDGAVLFLQCVMTPAGGGLVTGDGSALLWVDASL